MIALLLAAQLSATAAPASPAVDLPPPATGELLQLRPKPKLNCLGNIGRMEVRFIEPAALYRKSDRPAQGLRRWADYPQPMLCAIDTAR